MVSTLLTGIVNYWKLDDSLADELSSNDLTTGGTTFAAGKINNSAVFNAGSDYLRTTNAITSRSIFSMICWFKFASATGSAGNQIMNIRINDPSIFRDASNKLQVWADSISMGESTNTFGDTDWHLGILVADGSRLKLYVDNVEEMDVAWTGSNSNEVLNFGDNGLGTDTFIGNKDEAGLWSKALSINERSELWNSGSGLQYPFGDVSVPDNAVFHSMNF